MSQWLERLAAQTRDATTSPAPHRPYSPASRKSSQLSFNAIPRRPGIPSRSSSLTIASLAGSSDSLPAAARVPPGAHLKSQLADSAVVEAQDPIQVLQAILGPVRALETFEDDADSSAGSTRPSGFIYEVDFDGLSLSEFAQAPLAPTGADGISVPHEETQVYNFEKERDRFEDLHKSILACDDVLKSVETYLTSFQADLAAVSSEIESLQNRSTNLHDRVENRRAVEKILGPEVEALSVPPVVVRKIVEGAVDEHWLRALQELEKRSKALDNRLKDGKEIKAVQDVKPIIDDISTKAVERIRDYVVAQIRALRSPSINAQVIQQNNFLPYKEVYAFLALQQPVIAGEISQAYNNTMRWYYAHNFTRYRTALEKLKLHIMDQSDTISDSGVRKTVKVGAPHDAFSIGRRLDILRSTSHAALPSFAAEDDKGIHHIEVPFRTFNLALVDNASAEYSFLTEFFAKQQFQSTTKRFNEILQPTFDQGQLLTKQLIDQNLDAIGVLLCVRLMQQMAFELQRRKVPAAESYINGTNMLLWPRFQKIIDSHCESMRKATAILPGKPTGPALTLTSTAPPLSTAPHALTQRFANFVQAILALSSEAGDDEPVSNSLHRLRSDYNAFLLKLSKGIADGRKRERFLHNNYSLVCTIIGENDGKLADEMEEHFVDLRDSLKLVQ
jgi:hypothetical protein